MSSTLNFTFAQGDTIAEGLTLANELTEVAPASDLATVEILIKEDLAAADSTAVAPLGLTRRSTVGAEITIVDANLWTMTFKATKVETAAFTPGTYGIVCTAVDALGNVAEAFRGSFTIRPRGSDPAT